MQAFAAAKMFSDGLICCYITQSHSSCEQYTMDIENDYLSRMPFNIVFIDPLHTDFNSSSQQLNEYIARHPEAHSRLHQPKFAGKILEMAAHNSTMRVVIRKADARVKHDLHYIIRHGVFPSDEQMWAFINAPENLAAVKS